jgi:hypothetical protein
MWKKAIWPLLLILVLILALAGAVYYYERQWGADGPFPDEEHHGHQQH